MRSWLRLLGLTTLTLAAIASTSSGHPGGLNPQGCHNNRKTGDYHCHRTGPDPVAPRRAVPSESTAGVVKKSRSGICHAPGSIYYARTLNFTSFNSLQACLESGGRMPLR